jgi:hypothetical protein
MKTKLTMTSLCSAMMAFTCISSCADSPQNQKTTPPQFAEVTKWTVSVPLGYFLLIHKDNTTCAIRYTDNKTASGGYSTSYSEGNGHYESRFYAEYDYFYQDDGSGDFKKNNVITGHDKLVGVSGTWSPSDQTDSISVKCGALKLRGLSGVAFYQGLDPQDEGIELAPTKWRDVSEINFSDPKIKWYRYDKTRQTIKIPILDLW